MASSSQTTVKALGLNINPNFLDLPNGTLVTANDVIIRRANVIESRRGNSDWSEHIASSDSRSKQVMEYKNRILTNIKQTLQFDTNTVDIDGRAIFDAFDGSVISPGNYRIKSVEANKNLYFTTNDGIKKLSATDAAEFTTAPGYIQDAGAVKAIDFTTTLDIVQGETSGFLPIDSGVAYRDVWGYNDVNTNLILGSPSNRSLVYNSGSNSLVMDFNYLLYILDIFGAIEAASPGNTLISNTNYYADLSLAINPLGIDLKNNMVALAAKLDTDILLGQLSPGLNVPLKMNSIQMDFAGVVTINFASDPRNYISIGDWVNLTGLNVSGATPSLTLTVFNGVHQVTASSATTISFQYTYLTGQVPYQISPAIAVNSAALLNSYNYTNIIVTGDDAFPSPLNNLDISSPITSGQLATIQDVLGRILTRLEAELPRVIATALQTAYLIPYTQTTSANVILKISIPTDSQGNQLDSSYFLQVYRSNVFNAFNGSQGDTLQLGITTIPDDELHLVFEYFPTATDFANGYVLFQDSYPDSLAQFNTPLYTNPATGDGILQSNDVPPLAQDINLFRNVIFYANTQTRHTIPNLQLIGVDNITSGDEITIANVDESSTYTFVDGVEEQTQFTFTTTTSINSTYFFINSAEDVHQYYVWYNVDQTGTDPAPVPPAGVTYIGIEVSVLSTDIIDDIASRTGETLNDIIYSFTLTNTLAGVFSVSNIDAGITTDATNFNVPGLTISVTVQGDGEDVSTGHVLISRTISAAVNIDLTAKSFIRVINGSSTSPIYAYYTSGDNTIPGQMTLQSKVLADTPFYVVASGAQFDTGINGIGSSFSPNISPIHVVTGTTIVDSGTSGFVTFDNVVPHGMQNGAQIIITNTDCDPIYDGVWTVYNITPTTFDVPNIYGVIITPGTRFSWELTSDSVVSTNSVKPNRLYYSKFNQPDAVPLLNYFDIGREDKAILRIFPLRTTLFIFKEDGLYRVSGQASPFVVQLFDSSCVLIAPDSVDVADNTVYAWTSKGITNVTESGTNEISTPVDIELFKLATYPNFNTLTWGVGYNSDSSYTTYTNAMPTDEVATIGFRYSSLTHTWTNIIRSQTCGIVKTENDLLYMGSGIDNIINQERKNFTRTDYADKDFTLQISSGMINTTGKIIQFSSVADLDIGDALVQDQELTIYIFNNLLQQLDREPVLTGDYFDTLEASIGTNLRNDILALAHKLDSDPGISDPTYGAHIADYTVNISVNDIGNPTLVTTSIPHNLVDGRIITISGSQSVQSIDTINGIWEVSNTGTWGSSTTFNIPVNVTTGGTVGLSLDTAPTSSGFADIEACYNAIINQLNNDPGLLFNNFQIISHDTPVEAVIIAVNRVTKKVTLNLGLQWVIGPAQIYKAIPCEIQYAPLTFGDVLKLKQVYEATAMFSNTAFTNAMLSFSSDLKPDFISIFFSNLGNGIFGSYSDPGFGGGYFGGGGNAKPFRTLIPRPHQRCRFLNIKWAHKIAREICEQYGVTLTANVGESTRAYR